MTTRFFRGIALLFLVWSLSFCTTSRTSFYPEPSSSGLPREFRAAWVATVANINWPSRPGLPVPVMKNEALELLDLLVEHNFNAVIFQVRPQCDALYRSELEPWSYYLTGQQGKAPEQGFDPLAFWVEEAHRRGLELHAWLNPYRAHHVSGDSITEASIVKQRPDLVAELANGYWWMIPTLEGTQDHSYDVVMDIVRRYDIDGIHFDDYFYPYPSYHDNQDFPDEGSWQAYRSKGGKLSKGDWRRVAVNSFIKRVYKGIKKEKPYVKFGLSPFGIWRPGNPASIAGFDQYDQLYADAKLWLNEGWIDYYSPQLYWPINQIPQSFPVLLGWWARENTQNRHLWPGSSIGRLRGDSAIDETVNQIMITRGMLPASPGLVHWSIAPLVDRPAMRASLLAGPYQKPALIPPSPWLGKNRLEAPQLRVERDETYLDLSWTHPAADQLGRWVLSCRYGSNWEYSLRDKNLRSLRLPLHRIDTIRIPARDSLRWDSFLLKKIPLEKVRVSVVDRIGHESPARELQISQ